MEERAIGLIGSLDRQVHRQITKPVYMVGEEVYAPFVHDGVRQWYPGRIMMAICQQQTTVWGSVYCYNVTFVVGDEANDIPEEFVFGKEEYLLNEEYSLKQHAIKNVVDKTSKDRWASRVGWYEVIIRGRKRSFSSLKEAKKAIEESYGE